MRCWMPSNHSFLHCHRARHRIAAPALYLAGLLLALPGCHERSVRPGVNDSYKGDIDVSKWVERFEGESREIFTQRRRIVEAARITPGMTVADIGAGTGLFVAPFAEAVGARGRVFAVDIVPKFLAHIDQRAADYGLSNVETVLCKEDSVELPPGSVDLAFVCDTYHHFEYPGSTTASIHRALRAGGELVVIDFERIPGVGRAWVIDHVRAGKGTVIGEIESVGFELIDDGSSEDFLDENYMIRFRKID